MRVIILLSFCLLAGVSGDCDSESSCTAEKKDQTSLLQKQVGVVQEIGTAEPKAEVVTDATKGNAEEKENQESGHFEEQKDDSPIAEIQEDAAAESQTDEAGESFAEDLSADASDEGDNAEEDDGDEADDVDEDEDDEDEDEEDEDEEAGEDSSVADEEDDADEQDEAVEHEQGDESAVAADEEGDEQDRSVMFQSTVRVDEALSEVGDEHDDAAEADKDSAAVAEDADDDSSEEEDEDGEEDEENEEDEDEDDDAHEVQELEADEADEEEDNEDQGKEVVQEERQGKDMQDDSSSQRRVREVGKGGKGGRRKRSRGGRRKRSRGGRRKRSRGGRRKRSRGGRRKRSRGGRRKRSRGGRRKRSRGGRRKRKRGGRRKRSRGGRRKKSRGGKSGSRRRTAKSLNSNDREYWYMALHASLYPNGRIAHGWKQKLRKKVGSDSLTVYQTNSGNQCAIGFQCLGTNDINDIKNLFASNWFGAKSTVLNKCGITNADAGFYNELTTFTKQSWWNSELIPLLSGSECSNGLLVLGYSMGGSLADMFSACTNNAAGNYVDMPNIGKVNFPTRSVTGVYTYATVPVSSTQTRNNKDKDGIFKGHRFWVETALAVDPSTDTRCALNRGLFNNAPWCGNKHLRQDAVRIFDNSGIFDSHRRRRATQIFTAADKRASAVLPAKTGMFSGTAGMLLHLDSNYDSLFDSIYTPQR